MKCINLLLLFSVFCGTWRLARPTCVLESDFGFTINCAFKKSGLFRVRNLGGVKAHIGLGFSLGDELGFKESLSNLESNRRRSSEASQFEAQLIQAQQKKNLEKRLKTPDLMSALQVAASKRSAGSTQRAGPLPAFRPIPAPAVMGIAVPAFNDLPSAVSRKSSPGGSQATKGVAVVVPVSSTGVHASFHDKSSGANYAIRRHPATSNDLLPGNSIQALLAATNMTTEQLLESALVRQQIKTVIPSTSSTTSSSTTTTTTTTTTEPPLDVPEKYANSAGKVMNAPKEYYPVGYDKNFDDNFASRVELPETSFYCGDQKHFPGLYADEDLGCMVFHVCALTDDGLIMKSFLCPQSTVFDQTILKCNWWFYVNCADSKKLYDSNIPISKSYQLMKALTFFSAYKKENSTATTTTAAPEPENE